MKAPQDEDVVILREDDPRHDPLLAQGWIVVAESWGARLELPDSADMRLFQNAVRDALDAGYVIGQLKSPDAADMRELFEDVRPDFPQTPATRSEPLPDDLADLLDRGQWLGFGARTQSGSLVAFTTLTPAPGRWEVDRTAVIAEHRRRGLAKAVKATSILATYTDGARRWGTGGAAVNKGSLAMNASLGFVLEPRWHSLAKPTR